MLLQESMQKRTFANNLCAEEVMTKERPEARNEGVFTPDSSSNIKEAFCGICNDKMSVERGIMGATSFMEGMSRSKHLHDRFECPNLDEKWHIQVKAIRKKMNDTPSKAIEDLMAKEVEGILKTRKPTKEAFNFWVT